MISYDMPLYRPPAEADNLILQATYGCSYNQCAFCNMYKEKQYRPRPLPEVFSEIEQAAVDWPDVRRVFLADGDALALPTEHLLAILEKLQDTFAQLTRVSCYATPSNILHKSVQELKRLKAGKLSLFYLGIESGANTILKKITKGATFRGILDAMLRAQEADVKISATVILGLGGQHYWLEHIEKTAELLNSAPVRYLSTLQLYLQPEDVAFEKAFGEPFLWQDDMSILLEQKHLISQLSPPSPVIFRSNHTSNCLALAGNLPKDKQRLINEIDSVLHGQGKMRPHFSRGL